MEKILIYLSLIILVSCSKNALSQENHITTKSKEILIKEILENGDLKSYELLSLIYLEESREIEMLPYAMILAHKYDSSRAYFDVYQILYSSGYYVKPNFNECYDNNLSCLDNKTRNLALKYFREAIMKGDKNASEILFTYYDKESYFPVEELYKDEKLKKKAKENLTQQAVE